MQTTHTASGPARRLWLAEHYWPDLDGVAALARTARVQDVGPPVRWVASLLLPGQRTAFGLFAAGDRVEVVQALAEVRETADRVDLALQVPAVDRLRATNGRKPRT